MSPSVACIVPIGGAAHGLNRCLVSLARLDPPPQELILVLDGDQISHRRSIQAVEFAAPPAGPTVQVLAIDQAGGPAAARNLGAEHCSSELLFFLDSDVEAPTDLIEHARRVLASRPKVSAAIGSYDANPAAPELVSRYRNLLHHYTHQQARDEASTFWGACGVVQRRAFEEVGGFDPSFGQPSIEDIELGHRLRRADHHIAMVKSLQVKHLKRWTWRSVLTTDLFQRAIPWTELMLRGDGLLNDLNVKTRERVAVALAGLLAGSIPASLLWPQALLGGALALLTLILVNFSLYRFFQRQGGFWFGAGAAGCHFIYLLICGLGFGLGYLSHLSRRRSSTSPLPDPSTPDPGR